MEHSLNYLMAESIKKHWEQLALTDFNGSSYQYRDVARKVAKLHILFENCGIEKGDRIATCGKNSAQLSIAIVAALSYGAVAVPILHEFKADTIHHLVNHSDAKLLFTDASIWENLDFSVMSEIKGAINISDYSLLSSRNEELTKARTSLNELFGKKYPERFTKEDVKYYESDLDELALINYTSGSTGFSKGVMLSNRALYSNVKFCIENLDLLKSGDGIICMLPLAHMFGLVIELLHTFVKGCHIHFLTRIPSPKVILDAFEQVKPKVIIAVPLILEKIIKTRVFPLLEKPVMSMLLKVPFVDTYLLGKIKDKLESTFGGNLQQIIIGGAALNKDVAHFLKKINFPVTVGYGMTECAPLISYAPWQENPIGACGRIVERMEGKIVHGNNEHEAGELWVRGDNVMMGYYKNEEATTAVLKDGWLNTGDLCEIDENGFLYIKGRSKTMILGPSGQNIYPEEIEQQINNLPYVCESLVIDDGGKLIALIYPDIENGTKQGMDFNALTKLMEENITGLNKTLPAYSKIAGVKMQTEEFEKTPKRSIKRFLYQH